MVLTMVCHNQNYWVLGLSPSSGILQNYWVFGLSPSFGILGNKKHDVSETRSVYILR
jgi:hypothetical protein